MALTWVKKGGKIILNQKKVLKANWKYTKIYNLEQGALRVLDGRVIYAR